VKALPPPTARLALRRDGDTLLARRGRAIYNLAAAACGWPRMAWAWLISCAAAGRGGGDKRDRTSDAVGRARA